MIRMIHCCSLRDMMSRWERLSTIVDLHVLFPL